MRQHEQAVLFVKKALDDLQLLDEVLSSKKVSDDIFGFHAQQATEKFLKALLSEHALSFPRTHNLRLLMDLLSDAGYTLPANLADLDQLTPFGTLFRYEDITTNVRIDRNAVLRQIKALREFVEKQIA